MKSLSDVYEWSFELYPGEKYAFEFFDRDFDELAKIGNNGFIIIGNYIEHTYTGLVWKIDICADPKTSQLWIVDSLGDVTSYLNKDFSTFKQCFVLFKEVVKSKNFELFHKWVVKNDGYIFGGSMAYWEDQFHILQGKSVF